MLLEEMWPQTPQLCGKQIGAELGSTFRTLRLGRKQPHQQTMNGFRFVFSGGAVETVRPLETGWTLDFHRPFVAGPRTDYGYPPISPPVAQHMLDDSHHLRACDRVAGVLHFDGHGHNTYCTNRIFSWGGLPRYGAWERGLEGPTCGLRENPCRP